MPRGYFAIDVPNRRPGPNQSSANIECHGLNVLEHIRTLYVSASMRIPNFVESFVAAFVELVGAPEESTKRPRRIEKRSADFPVRSNVKDTETNDSSKPLDIPRLLRAGKSALRNRCFSACHIGTHQSKNPA